MSKLALITLLLTGAASNTGPYDGMACARVPVHQGFSPRDPDDLIIAAGNVDTSASLSNGILAGHQHFVPRLASNAFSIDTFIGVVSLHGQHLAGIPSWDAPYVSGAVTPTYTCRAVTIVPADPLEGDPMDHHPRIRLKSVCYEWYRSWSAPKPIPVLPAIVGEHLHRAHTGTDIEGLPISSFVYVALNAPIHADINININITSTGLITIQPSPPAFADVALIAPVIDADVDQSSGVQHITSFILDTRNTDFSRVLLLIVAAVFFPSLLIASCVTLFFVILLRNKRHYKVTSDLRTRIKILEIELDQRVSTEEENIRLRNVRWGS
ncbi:hypothetical protein FRB95_009705 [Tulasnella sp. JGI-2019a]|nr:hypothetical protein FRB95_009705 [Tulasnella sp. JGI-2019a]